MARGPWRSRLLDIGLVAVVSVFAAFLSGAQRWTGFNSPDSEFYASLALFGDDVAGRAIDPAYTTTRLGYIVPVRLLTDLLGPWNGFAAWRLVLIVVIVGSLYGLVRLAASRGWAVLVSAVGALNTMVLSFVGNTYLTGTLIAGILLLLLLGAWPLLSRPRVPWLPALASGVVVAWLVMVNPYGALLGLSMWLGLRAYALVQAPAGRWRALVVDGATALAAFAITGAVFLVTGLQVFPGRSWLGTYLEWNSRLDYSVFVGDPDVWQRDIALLVPLAVVALALLASLFGSVRRAGVAALLIALLNWGFTFGYLWLVPGPWLESPTYVALLWPGALAAAALSFAAVVGHRDPGWAGAVTAGALLPLVLWSGRWERDLSGAQGLLIVCLPVLLFLVTALWLRRSPASRAAPVMAVVTLGALAISAQLLQNGRGLLGIYGQFPFRAAYVDFQTEELMRSKVAAQEFVLATTRPDDVVGVWSDADRLTAGIAAMQLWSNYNAVGYSATMTSEEADGLRQLRPTVVAMYAPQREQVYAFWQSLPPETRASVPECTTVPFLGIGSPEAHICVTRLRW